jgi:hypothetical protein
VLEVVAPHAHDALVCVQSVCSRVKAWGVSIMITRTHTITTTLLRSSVLGWGRS